MKVIFDPILGHIRTSDFVAGSTTTVTSVGTGVSLVVGPSSIKSLIAGTNIVITDNGNDLTITSTGEDITVVANFSALPSPGTVTGQFYWCSASQGTAWLPGALLGTYYSAGLYYSNGITWEFLAVPYQATQAAVDAGIVTDQFITPSTFKNATITIPGLTAGNVTTNANLTGPITSVGNATSIALQTGTGTTFAMQTSPVFVTNITTEKIYGGSGALSKIDYVSTSGTGIVNGTAHEFWGGTNGATTIMQMLNDGTVSATGPFFIGSTTPLVSEYVSIQRNSNSSTNLFISNTTSGTAGRSQIAALITGNVGISIIANSALFTTSGIQVANTSVLNSGLTGGLNVGTSQSAQVSFWTNNTERSRYLSSGEFIIGGTALISSEFVSIQKNANAITQLTVSNTTSGTAGRSVITALAVGAGVSVQAVSAGYTTSGITVAGCGAVISSQTNGLNVGTTSSSQVSIWTNNTLRATFAATTGDVSFTGILTTNLSTNGPNRVSVINGNGSGSALATFLLNNGTYNSQQVLYGTGFTTAGLLVANLSLFYTDSTVGTAYVNTVSSSSMKWAIGGTGTANEIMRATTKGLGVMTLADPTAYLMLGAGTATANTGPLKFISSGTGLTGLLATPEAGVMEFTTYGLWMTTTGAARRKILEGLVGAAAPSTSVLTAFINYYGTGGTVALSTPNTWITVIGDDGATYKIPGYS